MGNTKGIKPLIIFHADCQDGFGAAFAAYMALGYEAEYVPVQYGSEKHKFGIGLPTVDEREVYILDFSFPRDIMDSLFANAKRVVWLDHHKTAFEMWCEKYEKGMRVHQNIGNPDVHELILDDNKSGALLAWEWFHGCADVPMLIKHIDDYDRWQFKLKGTKEINKALWSFTPWTFPLWQEIIDDDHYGSMWSQGSAILRAHEQHVAKTVKEATMECCISTYTNDSYGASFEGLAANCPPFLQSDVGHELATKSGTFGLLWCIDKDNRCKCSLRSNGEYDVSAIAKAFGGGGHRNAAGFETDIETLMSWLT